MASQATYELGRQLGKGGFATVFEGHNGTSKPYAIKCVQTASMKPQHAQKFIAELVIHSKLQHPNIVQFHEAYPYRDDTTHMVLELCPNGSLKEMQAKRNTLSYPELRRFGIQLCGALHYLHSKCIVHRDLKLQNVLLDWNMNIKLADLGLVGLLKSDDDKDVIKRLTLCGTPNYMAPEMWARQGHDQRLDIWALGAVLFYLAVGWAPFSKPGDRNIQAIRERASKTEIQWPDKDSVLCPSLQELLEVMMHPEEENRPGAVQVSEHPFFAMRGGIPPALEPQCREKAPTWINAKRREMWAYAPRIPLDELVQQCGLKTGPQRSIIKEIEKEEVARLAPSLPLKSTYRPRVVSKPLADITIKPRRTVSRQKVPSFSCIGPTDPVERVEETPLAIMYSNLRQQLKITEEGTTFSDISISLGTKASSPPPLVHSWFTHKLGFGYMLVNGDIGAMLADSPSGFLVEARTPDSISFLARNPNTNCFDRFCQAISTKCDTADPYGAQRNAALKVCSAFVRHLNKKRGEMPPDLGARITETHFIRAFCRVGSVQVFTFGAGGVQFNFPDRTKLLISPDGLVTSFYHLPLEIARAVRRKEIVEAELDSNLVLHLPLAMMLASSPTMNQWLCELLDANEFRQKITFVKDVLRVWDHNGGPGKGREKLDWNGMCWVREEPKEPSWGYFDI